MTTDEARSLRSKTVRYVGVTGTVELPCRILTVSAKGVRVRFAHNGSIEQVHPDDLASG